MLCCDGRGEFPESVVHEALRKETKELSIIFSGTVCDNFVCIFAAVICYSFKIKL